MTDATTMTLTGPDGVESAPFNAEDLKKAAAAVSAKLKNPKMKPDPDLDAATDAASTVAATELRAFVERIERLDAEKKDIMDAQKEVMAEAKGRGYDTKILRKLIALRKRDANDLAEEEAVLDMYKLALGM